MFAFGTSTAVAIDAPSDVRGTELSQSRVKWEWAPVTDAAKYELTIDGINVGTTNDTQFYSNNLWAGEHSLTVRAMHWNGEYSQRTQTIQIHVSDWFSSSSFNRSFVVGEGLSTASTSSASVSTSDSLSKPKDVRGTLISAGTIKWEWAAVSGAQTYDVTVDGGYAGTTQETSFKSSGLWQGDHSMTVIAVSSNGESSSRSATAKTWSSSGSASTTTSVASSTVVEYIAPPPVETSGTVDSSGPNMVDPASYEYDEVYNRSGYDLVFSDEFNGSSLNSFRWNASKRWDGEYNGERYEYRLDNDEKQFYVNILSEDEEHIRDIVPYHNPFEFNGSRLAIRAVKNPLKTNNGEGLNKYGALSDVVSQQDFLSGSIATNDKFSQKFGYFEARIKIPNHEGTFPAFWLFHEKSVAEGTQKTEIDIMENLGHNPLYVYNAFHYYKNVSTWYGGDLNSPKPTPDGQVYVGVDFSQDFHVYAVEWEPGKITWLVDGDVVSELSSSEADFEELHVILNLAIGGKWTNDATNVGGLGRTYPNQSDLDNFRNPALEIDYVRVYKRN